MFIWLLFAHFLGDIAFQSDWQAQNKGKKWYVMLSHAMIWGACISMALQYLGIFSLWKAILLVLGHIVIDSWKCRQPKDDAHWWMIYPDQFAHLCQLLVVFYL
jgi:hypothetical protein